MDTGWFDEKEENLRRELKRDIMSFKPEVRTEIIETAIRIIRKELPNDPEGEKTINWILDIMKEVKLEEAQKGE